MMHLLDAPGSCAPHFRLWLLRLLRRLSDDECSFPVAVREQTFISAFAVAFLVLVAGWVVHEWTVVVRFLALAFVVERTNPIRIGGGPRLAGRWIRRLVLIALLCSLTLLVCETWIQAGRSRWIRSFGFSRCPSH